MRKWAQKNEIITSSNLFSEGSEELRQHHKLVIRLQQLCPDKLIDFDTNYLELSEVVPSNLIMNQQVSITIDVHFTKQENCSLLYWDAVQCCIWENEREAFELRVGRPFVSNGLSVVSRTYFQPLAAISLLWSMLAMAQKTAQSHLNSERTVGLVSPNCGLVIPVPKLTCS